MPNVVFNKIQGKKLQFNPMKYIILTLSFFYQTAYTQENNILGKPRVLIHMDYAQIIDSIGESRNILERLSGDNGRKVFYGNGLLKSKSSFDYRDSTYNDWISYTYNKNGLVDSTFYNISPDSVLLTTSDYKYCKKKKVKTKVDYIQNKKVAYTNYDYNKNNQRIKLTTFTAYNDSLNYEEFYEYDSIGNNTLIIKKFYWSHYQIDTLKMKYDENNFMTKRILIIYVKGKIYKSLDYLEETFNIKQLRSELKSNNETITWKYLYDTQGNWIVREEFRKDKLYRISKRLISYYD